VSDGMTPEERAIVDDPANRASMEQSEAQLRRLVAEAMVGIEAARAGDMRKAIDAGSWAVERMAMLSPREAMLLLHLAVRHLATRQVELRAMHEAEAYAAQVEADEEREHS